MNDTVVQRYDHVYEVDPALMQDHIQQHEFPEWETRRIVDGRWEHLDWMHAHWADSVLCGEELLSEPSPSDNSAPRE